MEKKEYIKDKYDFNDLLEIMSFLRSEEGCPWDRVQTHKSIRKNLIEETYEVLEGIDKDNDDILIEELGDLLLQVVFHCRIAQEEGRFNISDVTDGVCKKLVRRHPALFYGDNTTTWDEVKIKEKGVKAVSDSMKSVCMMPALMRAQKVSSKAAKAGFEWHREEKPFEKIDEEKKEYLEALAKGDKQSAFDEAGDLLFSCVTAIRRSGIDCEEALTASTNKFIDRFTAVENAVKADDKDMLSLSDDELVEYWIKAKNSKSV